MSKIIFGQKDKPNRCVDCYFYKAGSREYRTATCEGSYREIRRVPVTKTTPGWCPLTLVGVWIPVKKSGQITKRWDDELAGVLESVPEKIGKILHEASEENA